MPGSSWPSAARRAAASGLKRASFLAFCDLGMGPESGEVERVEFLFFELDFVVNRYKRRHTRHDAKHTIARTAPYLAPAPAAPPTPPPPRGERDEEMEQPDGGVPVFLTLESGQKYAFFGLPSLTLAGQNVL